jgi:hypothetical protein
MFYFYGSKVGKLSAFILEISYFQKCSVEGVFWSGGGCTFMSGCAAASSIYSSTGVNKEMCP